MKFGEPSPPSRPSFPLSLKAWSRLARDRLRWLARRWTFALAGFAMGFVLVAWLYTDAINTLIDHQDQVKSLRQKLATQQDRTIKTQQHEQEDTLQGPPEGLAWLPAKNHQALIWLQLSQLLGQHAVQLKSLRPVPEQVVAPVDSQAVAVRLHADFDDWVNFWADLNARGPVWSIDRLRMSPQGEGVDIEAVLRVWLSDERTRGPDHGATKAVWPGTELMRSAADQQLRLAGLRQMASDVFVRQQGSLKVPLGALIDPPEKGSINLAGATGLDISSLLSEPMGAQPLAATPSLTADPGQWPLSQVRLLGVWHQAQGAHVILAAGPHWVSARVGQSIGSHGHRIVSIHGHEVHLRARSGVLRVLSFEKAPP